MLCITRDARYGINPAWRKPLTLQQGVKYIIRTPGCNSPAGEKEKRGKRKAEEERDARRLQQRENRSRSRADSGADSSLYPLNYSGIMKFT